MRKVKKVPAAPGNQVEIVVRPDGTKVRQIRQAVKKTVDSDKFSLNAVDNKPLDGFLSLESKLGT